MIPFNLVWLGDNLIAETDNKAHYQTYLYEPDPFKPLALISGRGKAHKVYHYHLDQIGTPTDLTDTAGNSVWSMRYYANSRLYLKHKEDIHNPLRFQGQYFDAESGLHYNQHRYFHYTKTCAPLQTSQLASKTRKRVYSAHLNYGGLDEAALVGRHLLNGSANLVRLITN